MLDALVETALEAGLVVFAVDDSRRGGTLDALVRLGGCGGAEPFVVVVDRESLRLLLGWCHEVGRDEFVCGLAFVDVVPSAAGSGGGGMVVG